MDKTISSAGKATISESEGLNTVSKDIIPIFWIKQHMLLNTQCAMKNI